MCSSRFLLSYSFAGSQVRNYRNLINSSDRIILLFYMLEKIMFDDVIVEQFTDIYIIMTEL